MNAMLLLRSARPVAAAIACAILCPLAGTVVAQEDDAAPAAPPKVKLRAPQPKDLDEAKQMAVATYAQIVEATYADARRQAANLRAELKALVAQPTMLNHLSAKLGWLEARMPYLQSESFRFYGGPIDGDGGPENTLNAWPLDESYIDYVEGDPEAGIISKPDTYPRLTPEVLAALHGAGGERKVATGYHAIEFLLWGQDLSAKSAGKRTHDDYKAEKSKHAARRAAYLLACADLMVRQLTELHAEWVAGEGENYRTRFERLPSDEALQKILTGVVTLAGSELAGERLGAAYETMDQEQSQFSDTTHIDILHNSAGISNLIAGAYVGVDGKVQVLGVGLAGVADQVSAERGESLRAAANAAMKAAAAIRAPFDQEIVAANLEGRARVKVLIDALNGLAGETAGLAGDLGIEMSNSSGGG